MAEESKVHPVMHISRIQTDGGNVGYLFLRKLSDREFQWFKEIDNSEHPTSIEADNIPEALRLAHRQWKNHGYRTVKCGSRFTLPERDEIGVYALFFQMVASYSSMNGVYFDVDLGFNCIVNNASLEAKGLWERLRKEKRL
jgi:hypothetical protein